jgi:hypothetical protein
VIAANKAQERIGRLSAACLALAGATRTDQGDHAIFRVSGRVFAYLLNNHHGDGILGVCCKVLPATTFGSSRQIPAGSISRPTSDRADGSAFALTCPLWAGLRSENCCTEAICSLLRRKPRASGPSKLPVAPRSYLPTNLTGSKES